MSGDPELEAMAAVLRDLQPLDPPMQGRVIRWVIERLGIGDHVPAGAFSGAQQSPPDQKDAAATHIATAFRVSPGVSAWTRLNGITDEELESAFHETPDGLCVIAREVPGSSRREKVLNCYLLAGACSLLSRGEADFTDQKARELCEEFGCLDTTNHAKYLAEKGTDIVGSKSKGWALTALGKKRAGLLVKAIAASNVP